MTFKMTAERYAIALHDVAVDAEELGAVKEDMKKVADILDALPEVKQFCSKTNATIGNSLSVVEIAFLPLVSSALTRNALTAMAENGRLTSLPFLSEAFFEICAEEENRLPVLAEFAHPPEATVLSELKNELARKTGKKIELSTGIDPSILGGVVITWKHRIINGSVRNRLKQLRRQLETLS